MKNTLSGILTATASLLFACPVLAQEEAPVCVDEQQALTSLINSYTPEFEKLKTEGDDISEDGDECDDITAKFRCSSVPADWRFHRPTVRNKVQTWSFHAPKVYRKRHSYSFDTVKSRSKMVKIGEYVKCRHLKCRKEDITTKVPEFYTDRTSFSFDTPVIEWDKTSMTLHVPQFFREEVHWKFKWVKCELIEAAINPPDECKDLEQRGQSVERRSNELAMKQKSETLDTTLALTGCYRNTMLQSRSELSAQMDSAIETMDGQIRSIRAAGGDPEKLADENGAVLNLVAQLETMRVERDKALKEMDKAIQEMNEQDIQLVADAGAKIE